MLMHTGNNGDMAMNTEKTISIYMSFTVVFSRFLLELEFVVLPRFLHVSKVTNSTNILVFVIYFLVTLEFCFH